MESFWESSPEWQRKEELFTELEVASTAMREAEQTVLFCVRHDAVAPSGAAWEKAREAYKEVYEAWEAAFDGWSAADKAFNASAAGKARARYFKDPLATLVEEIVA